MDTILSLPSTGNDDGSLRAQLRRAGRALTAPSRFFRFDYPRMPTENLLTFGLANAWAAAAIAFLVRTFNTLLLASLLDRWMQRLLSSEDGFAVWDLSPRSFVWEAGMLLLAPFLLLVQALFCALWTWLFANILIEENRAAPEPVTYAAALRIQAVALTANWYSLVPIFGGFLSFVVGLVLTVTGVRERFGVSTRRAVAVVLSPYLVIFGLGLLLLVLVVVGISQLPFQDFAGDFDWGQFVR